MVAEAGSQTGTLQPTVAAPPQQFSVRKAMSSFMPS
jgi:hypothetical protein